MKKAVIVDAGEVEDALPYRGLGSGKSMDAEPDALRSMLSENTFSRQSCPL
jgi:hypothetical protein